MYQKLRFVHDAEILLIPSAFAMKTGEAHWETLLRARAIECQCYVIASAQVGQHNTTGNKRQSWGHSIVFGETAILQTRVFRRLIAILCSQTRGGRKL